MSELQMRYPNIQVKLSNEDGNAFLILGRVMKALRRNEVSEEEIQKFQKEATSRDYDNLLRTCMEWVDVI